MADVTIRGAGLFGLCAAWACAEAGARVQLIDPAGPGAGASGGIVGALAPHVPENWNDKKAFQLTALLRAEGYWQRIEACAGLGTGYARLGRVQPIKDAAALALARRRAEGAHSLWQGKARWQVQPAGDDWHPLSPSGYVIHDSLSARLHPRMACAALARATARRGVAHRRQGRDQGLVIWATGAAGLDALSADLGAQVGTAIKGQAALVRLDRAHAPQVFADGIHIVPHGDGTVAIGSTSERGFCDPRSTDGQLNAVIDRARQALPALRDAPVIDRWAGLRPRARSRAPMIGPWPGRPGHFVLNGGFKIGLAMAPALADLIAALVVRGEDHIPAPFRVEASMPPRAK